MTEYTTNSSFPKPAMTTVVTISSNLDIYVSDATQKVISIAIFLVVNPIISFAGIATSIINITVFIKSGFSDTVNITLLGLSVSDLCLLLVTLWESVCIFPPFQQADIPFDPNDTGYITGGIPLTYFGRTTSWITAFITLERYLCVAFPLKVKTLTTPRRTVLVTIAIYILMAATVAPLLYTTRLEMKFFPDRNTTRLGLVFTSDRFSVEQFTNPISNVIVQIGSFLVVVLFTVLLISKLKRKSRWRERTTDKAVLLSRRDQTITRMIVLISGNFIVCYAGITIEYTWGLFAPDFTSSLAYRNLFLVFSAFAIMTQEVNASINLFIYLKMSTKYRQVFKTACCCTKKRAVA